MYVCRQISPNTNHSPRARPRNRQPLSRRSWRGLTKFAFQLKPPGWRRLYSSCAHPIARHTHSCIRLANSKPLPTPYTQVFVGRRCRPNATVERRGSAGWLDRHELVEPAASHDCAVARSGTSGAQRQSQHYARASICECTRTSNPHTPTLTYLQMLSTVKRSARVFGSQLRACAP